MPDRLCTKSAVVARRGFAARCEIPSWKSRGSLALITPASREFGPKFKAEIKVHCAGKPRTIAFWEQKLMRLLEALALKWSEIELDAANGKKLGYLFVREGKLKNARRHVSLTPASSGDPC